MDRRERERKGEKGRERERKGEKGRERERKGEKGVGRERKGEKGRGRVLPIGNHRRGARNHLIMPGKILIFTN
jgi:hypothetical protein